jgi:hypothetical protein
LKPALGKFLWMRIRSQVRPILVILCPRLDHTRANMKFDLNCITRMSISNTLSEAIASCTSVLVIQGRQKSVKTFLKSSDFQVWFVRDRPGESRPILPSHVMRAAKSVRGKNPLDLSNMLGIFDDTRKHNFALHFVGTSTGLHRMCHPGSLEARRNF